MDKAMGRGWPREPARAGSDTTTSAAAMWEKSGWRNCEVEKAEAFVYAGVRRRPGCNGLTTQATIAPPRAGFLL